MKAERPTLRSYARVSTLLKERIAAGEFEIGARLPPERELTIFYDVSRPTIREALIALEIEGVVTVRPGSGVYVISKHSRLGITSELDIDLLEVLQARRVMQSEACALAATQINAAQLNYIVSYVEDMRRSDAIDDIVGFEYSDRHFHLSIAEAGGNVAVTIAIATLLNVRTHTTQNGMLTSRLRVLANANDFSLYNAIVEALESGNRDKARIEMRNHYSTIIDAILDDMEFQAIDNARDRIKVQREFYRNR
jgi:DNA-binding FadR family transcriptional regulator